jgi:hypothetical protein
MTALRAFAGGAALAALVALAGCRDAPRTRVPTVEPESNPAAMPATLPPVSARISPTVGQGLRPAVPPGVLSRAAEARALERRAQVCPPSRPADPEACPPGPSDAVEIDWDGPREP